MSNLHATLIFSAVIIAIEAVVLIFRGKSWGPTSSKLVGLSLVALMTIIVAFSDLPTEQRSPAYALLGVVAGLLAGKSDNGSADA
jgi:hypothetical protein